MIDQSYIKILAFASTRDKKIQFLCENCGKKVIARAIIIRTKDNLLCAGCSISKTKSSFSSEKIEKILDKRKKTCQRKYGTDNGGGTLESQEKAKETFISKYGSLENAYIQRHLKKQKTCIERYGVDNFMKTEEGVETLKDSLIKKYGSLEESYIQRSLQAQKTFMKKYGVSCSLNSPEIMEKTKETLQNKYGVNHPMKSNIVKNKIIEAYGQIGRVKGYTYNDIHFDSSWELAMYIWLTDNKKSFMYHPNFPFTYIGDDNLEHEGYPDFLIEGKFYEIKGSQFFNESHEPYNKYNGKFWWGKYEALKKNNITILEQNDIKPYLEYIKTTYGKHYLKSFKKK